jgi:hypothetical protein
VSDVCLTTRPGYEARVAEAIQRAEPRVRVQTQSLVDAYVQRGMTLREGVFTVLFALALALAVAAFAVVSWLGRTPRRREIALLKSEGWTTLDVLALVAFENLLVSLLAAGAALLAAELWVGVLRAPLIAPFFLPDLSLFPRMEIPTRPPLGAARGPSTSRAPAAPTLPASSQPCARPAEVLR